MPRSAHSLGTQPAQHPSHTPSRTIVFSHANGFPAGTYGPIIDRWRQAGYRVEAIERIGHDPLHPVSNNWPHLLDALLTFVEQKTAGTGPAHLVGHSLGGYLSLMAAAQRPSLAQSVILLDSPVLTGWRAGVLRMGKRLKLAGRLSPGHVSQRRREQWPSAQALREHFASKAAFARWAPEMLDAYLATGFVPSTPGGTDRRLAFDRNIETAIYNSLPDTMGRIASAKRLRVPVSFIGGRQSTEIRQVGLAATRAVTQGRISWIDGTHLYPMERPEETAQKVLQWLSWRG